MDDDCPGHTVAEINQKLSRCPYCELDRLCAQLADALGSIELGAVFVQRLQADLDRTEYERDSNRLEVQASEHNRIRENEYLLGVCDTLRAALQTLADAADARLHDPNWMPLLNA